MYGFEQETKWLILKALQVLCTIQLFLYIHVYCIRTYTIHIIYVYYYICFCDKKIILYIEFCVLE